MTDIYCYELLNIDGIIHDSEETLKQETQNTI